MKQLLILSLFSLLVSSFSFAAETADNCDALAENNLRTNPKANLGSTQTLQSKKPATTTRK